jgi:hypothetical protein
MRPRPLWGQGWRKGEDFIFLKWVFSRAKMHTDHIVPFSQAGKSMFDNLQTLGEDGNMGKSNRDS